MRLRSGIWGCVTLGLYHICLSHLDVQNRILDVHYKCLSSVSSARDTLPNRNRKLSKFCSRNYVFVSNAVNALSHTLGGVLLLYSITFVASQNMTFLRCSAGWLVIFTSKLKCFCSLTNGNRSFFRAAIQEYLGYILPDLTFADLNPFFKSAFVIIAL